MMIGTEPRLDPTTVDRLVHEPARMAVLSFLDGVTETDYAVLQRVLGLTGGNLSAHLAKLAAGGLVTITKTFLRGVPQTTLAITGQGRDARAQHWKQLERIRDLSDGATASLP